MSVEVKQDYKLFQEDCFDVLPRIPDNSIDLIFTDPPYWTLDRWREVGTTTRLGGNVDPQKRSGWFKTIGPEAIEQLMKECLRVLKPNSHAFIMCDGQTLRYVLNYAAEYFNHRHLIPELRKKFRHFALYARPYITIRCFTSNTTVIFNGHTPTKRARL